MAEEIKESNIKSLLDEKKIKLTKREKKIAEYLLSTFIAAFVAVVFGWVLFRVEDVNLALQWLGRMLVPWKYTVTAYPLSDYMNPHIWTMMCAALLGMGPLQLLADRTGLVARWRFSWAETAALILLMALCIAALASSVYNPFIYFKF